MTTPQGQKSTYSGHGSNCVETAATPTMVPVRDSKALPEPHLAFPPSVWADFLAHAAKPGH
ncbi:DUF397 domain-containing protein [Streptomyces sp.]|uniref:DUF397 domain-containing protein n=1 Tax=Streptomyces sp. TaxID=1931 RepID=UPI002810EC69|nr:DUF397 domain-containing protein [Streptomyces sp.]